MEVRVGERLLCLAVLSSVLCMDSVLGKYVRGVVNTKEVSVCFPPPPLSLICCLATMTPPLADRSETDLTANPFAGVSLVDCSVRRGANSRFTDQVASHMCTALVSACETHSPLFCPKIPRHLRAYHAWRMFYPHHDSLLYYCCL